MNDERLKLERRVAAPIPVQPTVVAIVDLCTFFEL